MAATVNVLAKIGIVLAVLILLENVDALRTVQTFFDPGCTKTDCEGGVAYVKARGDYNTLHYVVTPIGPPTVLVIMTENTDGGVKIDWDKFMSDNMTVREESITLDNGLKVLYTYGVVFTRLFQYNDTSDTSNLNSYNINNTAWNVYDFTNATFVWEDIIKVSSDNSIMLSVRSSKDINGQTINNGSLQFKFNFFDHTDRATDLPHLQYTEDICQFDFTMMNINTGNMSLSRFALETVLFSTDSTTGSMKVGETKSIDDEYTPGVFKIYNWETTPENQEKGGFLQHKPVCYTDSSRTRDVATYVRRYSLSIAKDVKEVEHLLGQSAVLAYFGSTGMSALRMTTTNFSFGLGEDGTFTKTNYSVWTASIGYGVPPNDAVSTMVIGVISAGLGIPVVLISFGGIFICMKKRKENVIIDAATQRMIN